jgi:hypothetical protein
MKKIVWIEQQIEVEISAEDMVESICELDAPDRLILALRGISHCIVFLREVPEDVISLVNKKDRMHIVAEIEKIHKLYQVAENE